MQLANEEATAGSRYDYELPHENIQLILAPRPVSVKIYTPSGALLYDVGCRLAGSRVELFLTTGAFSPRIDTHSLTKYSEGRP